MISYFLLLLFLSTALCATYDELIDSSGFLSNKEDAVAGMVEIAIQKNTIFPNFDKSKSIFCNDVKFLAKYGDSPASYYASFAKCLYDHLDKTCSRAFTKGILDSTTKKETLHKIRLGVHEIDFFESYNGKFKISEGSAMLMIRTLNLIEPDRKSSWPLIKKLGEFCIREDCQKLVYDAALLNPVIPSIKMSRNIKDTVMYDKFIKDCYEFLDYSAAGIRDATVNELAVTIINGPFSKFASSTLILIIKQYPKVLANIANDQTNANNFANFIARTQIIKELFPFIKDSTEPKIIELKQLVFKLSKYSLKIEKTLAFKSESLRNEDLSAFSDVLTDLDLLKFYKEIDNEYVQICMKKIFDNIPVLIECILSPTISAAFKKRIIDAFQLFFATSLSPLMNFDGEVIYDFEPLLNIYLCPESYKIDVTADPFYLGMVLFPPYSKLGKSHLQKILSFLEEEYPNEYMNTFTDFSYAFLRSRSEHEEIFWDSLNVMHEFSQENQFGIGQILETLLIAQGEFFNAKRTKRIVKFCIENNIFSKTIEKAATKIASTLLLK